MANPNDLLARVTARKSKQGNAPSLSPLQKETYDFLGADQNVQKRGVILPIAKDEEGNRVFAYPEIMLQAAKSFVLPGFAASGGEYTQGDVTEMALDIGLGGSKPKTNAPAAAAQTIAKQIAPTPPPAALTKAEKLVLSRLQKDMPDEGALLSTIRKYQTPQIDRPLVMSGGKMTESLARGAAQLESGRAVTETATDAIARKSPESFEGMLKKTISPNFSVRDATKVLADEAEKVASPLYKKAFKKNPVVASKRLSRVLDTPAARQAIKDTMVDVQNRMQLAAKPDPELGMVARELLDMDVPGGVSKGFSLRTLNQIKIKMDKKINAGLSSTNAADKAAADALIQAKNALLDEIDTLDKSGSYAKARATRAELYNIENALEDGRTFFTKQGKNALTTEDLGKQFTSYTPQQQKAYKIGMMQDIMAKVRNVQDGSNPTRFLKTPAVQKRLEIVLGKDYPKVMEQAGIVSKTYEIRNKVLGGSQTSANQMAREAFNEIDPADIQDVMRGNPINFATRKVIERVMRAKMGLNDKVAGEVADILFTTDPKKRFAFAKKLQNVINSKQASQAVKEEARQKMQAFFAMDEQIPSSKFLPQAGPLATAERNDSGDDSVLPEPPNARDLLNQLKGGTIQNSNPLRITVTPDDIPAAGTGQSELGGSAGVDRLSSANDGFYNRLAKAESGGNILAQNPKSSAGGLYQFVDATWNSLVKKYGDQYGITKSMKMNPQAQEVMVRLLTDENRAALVPSLGREPTSGELYIAHFMGAPKAKKLLEMRGSKEKAARLFPNEAKANRPIFFDGNRARSVQEIISILERKVA